MTVFNGRAEIDVNEAAPAVVAALPPSTRTWSKRFERRDPKIRERLSVWRGGGQCHGRGRKAARAAIHITLDTGRQVNADVVILITENNSPEPYRILAWHDDFDGPV